MKTMNRILVAAFAVAGLVGAALPSVHAKLTAAVRVRGQAGRQVRRR